MFISRRTRGELLADVRELRQEVSNIKLELAKLDPTELTRLRQTVNNALRSLRRLDDSEPKGEVTPPASAPLTLNQARARARGML